MPSRKHCSSYEILVKDHGLEYKSGLTVKVKNNDLNKAIKNLKRKVLSEGVAKKVHEKMFYETGTARRKRERAEAKARWKRKQQLLDKLFNGG